MAELVDARGLGPRGENRGGSSPFARTNPLINKNMHGILSYYMVYVLKIFKNLRMVNYEC